MNEAEIKIACRQVQIGDAVRVSQLQPVADGHRLGVVISVRSLGAQVAIDTDLGVSALMPVNRSITVQRK